MKKIVLITFIINFIIADYASDIQPIFDSNCTSCHGYPNQHGDLILFSYEDVINSGTVVPGDASSSELFDRITRDESENGDMPPTGSLSDGQIELIEEWINNGASESDILGCSDSNAITCDDDINTLYFPECNGCSEGIPCDNYYNEDANIDNGMCMYNDVPADEEFSITNMGSSIYVDWSGFTPPVDDVVQYVLQRCIDLDGDTPVFSCEGTNSCGSEFFEESCESVEGCSWNSELDGELEYETCQQVIDQNSIYLGTDVTDNYILEDNTYLKYTFYVHYPNNNFWGSAWGAYYYESGYTLGDLNNDGILNVIDIVSLVNVILTNEGDIPPGADINGDGIANVIDIVSLVNLILS